MAISKEGHLALALRETLHLPPRLDVTALGRELKLSIVEVDADSFDGALLCCRNRLSGRILINSGMREQGRKRFTVAHEIGHFVLHRERQISCGPADIAHWENGDDKPERQADNFASELLLPSTELLKQIGDGSPSFQLVGSLAEFFGASLTATSRKYCEVTHDECAIVWSVDRIIRWAYSNGRFRHWIGNGRELSMDTLAGQMLIGQEVHSGMQEVPAVAWITDYRLPEGATIWEESRTMPFYNGCLSLLWVKREIRYRNFEQEELLEELDPQEFTIERKVWPTKSKRR